MAVKDRTSGVSVNDEFVDSSIRHAINIERYKNHEVHKIVDFMDDTVIPDMKGKLEKLLNKHKKPSARTVSRIKDLMSSSNEIVRAGIRAVRDEVKPDLQDLATTNAEWEHAQLSKAGAPVNITFNMPSMATVRSLVTSSPIHGRLFGTWFNGLSTSVASQVNQQLMIGLTSGESIPTIAKRLLGSDGLGPLGQSKRHVTTLVRTSVNHVSNASREAVFERNKDVIKKVKLVATLDSRTTLICINIDGKVFDVGDGPRPPLHMNCRTIVSPITRSWKELGIDLKEAPAGTRASWSGQVPDTLTYPQWLKKQTAAFQDEVLGPARAKLYRSGKVKLNQFLDASDNKLTLDELRAKSGLKPRRNRQ